MARISGLGQNQAQGVIGPIIYYMIDNQLFARERPAKKKNPPRTLAQMRQRVKMANLLALFRVLVSFIKPSFENTRNGQQTYRRFMSVNLKQKELVYLTKSMSEGNACILAPVYVSYGETIRWSIDVKESGGHMISSLAYGGPAIDETTTVALFNYYIRHGNPQIVEPNSMITFMRLTQTTDAVTGQPTVVATHVAIKLDENDFTRLSDHFDLDGFQVVDGFLACDKRTNSMVAWVYGYQDRQDRTFCTTQRLVGENAKLPLYTGDRAQQKAVESYEVNRDYQMSPNDNTSANRAAQLPAYPVQPGQEGDGGSTGGTTTPTYTISFRIEPDASWGSVTMVPAQMPVARGTQVRLTAAPANLKRFGHWSNGSTDLTITVTADSDRTLTATFENISNGSGNDINGEDFGSRSRSRKRSKK